MTDVERRQALEAIAAEVRVVHELPAPRDADAGRARARATPTPRSSSSARARASTRTAQGRPFVGRAGDLLVKLLASIGWRREEVFITNVVKCRPPDNRDPQPDEIAACAPYLRRQLEVLDPAVVVTLGRHSMARFMPGARISQAHGTVRPVDPATGARAALVFAMYHPAAALRTPAIERESYADIAGVPAALIDARRRREAVAAAVEPPRRRGRHRGDVEPPAATPPRQQLSKPAVDEPRPRRVTDGNPGAAGRHDDPTPQLTLF